MNTINPIKKKDTIVIYSGRFQPFHKGHHDVYRFLKERYDNVFIVTTNTISKDKKRYPFNFDEKIDIMKRFGRVETYDIYPKPITNPYSDYDITEYIKELKENSETLPPTIKRNIENIDLKNLLFIFAISDKDMTPTDGSKPRFIFPSNNLVYTKKKNSKGNPIPAKIQKIKSRKSFKNTTFNNISLNTNINFNYILTVPTNIFSVLGQNINSATELRNMIVNPPEGYTRINVLESLYDTKINLANKDMFELIINKIRESYRPSTPKKTIKSKSSASASAASPSKKTIKSSTASPKKSSTRASTSASTASPPKKTYTRSTRSSTSTRSPSTRPTTRSSTKPKSKRLSGSTTNNSN
jgi:cytidyltransferase-like protein